tara:strand:+ start:168 stop:356 length:189 start_codon:yes stop_codon:yes gene_type:complete
MREAAIIFGVESLEVRIEPGNGRDGANEGKCFESGELWMNLGGVLNIYVSRYLIYHRWVDSC